MQAAYHQPKTLEEAHAIMATCPDAVLMAGGTDLLVQRRAQNKVGPLISLRGIDELRGIHEKKDLMIGAGTTLTEIADNAIIRHAYPALVQSIEVLGSLQIRNVATLGGNLCNASPGADTAAPLIVYGARVKVCGGKESANCSCRSIAITDFFRGPGRTSLESGEILRGIVLDKPASELRSCFLRLGRIKMDIAIASLAVAFEWDGGMARRLRVAAGSVAPVPLRLSETEALLEGTALDADTLKSASAVAAAEVSPIDDIRASASYRRELIAVFLRRAISSALQPTGREA
jgi:aerobic carbon-monoxide dehydrogenase medium subunit